MVIPTSFNILFFFFFLLFCGVLFFLPHNFFLKSFILSGFRVMRLMFYTFFMSRVGEYKRGYQTREHIKRTDSSKIIGPAYRSYKRRIFASVQDTLLKGYSGSRSRKPVIFADSISQPTYICYLKGLLTG